MVKKKIRVFFAPRHSHLNPQGMALVLCLLLMTTLCLVGGAALSISGLNHKIVRNGAKQVQSFYLAEAGKEMALSYLKEDPLWRGASGTSPGLSGELMVNGNKGLFSVTVADCTADNNGIHNALIPAGYLLVESCGTWMDAFQTVSCVARIRPSEGSAAAFSSGVVVTSGAVTGSLKPLDEAGNEDSLLLHESITLPAANTNVIVALAHMAFSSLDDNQFDAALSGISDFWQDAPSNTRPNIFYVQGNLTITGSRMLHGIVFVEGALVSLEDESGIKGVLYAPNASAVTIHNTGASGRVVACGQLITGSGGVEITGNSASIRFFKDYADAFNDVSGDEWSASMVSGSWMPL